MCTKVRDNFFKKWKLKYIKGSRIGLRIWSSKLVVHEALSVHASWSRPRCEGSWIADTPCCPGHWQSWPTAPPSRQPAGCTYATSLVPSLVINLPLQGHNIQQFLQDGDCCPGHAYQLWNRPFCECGVATCGLVPRLLHSSYIIELKLGKTLGISVELMVSYYWQHEVFCGSSVVHLCTLVCLSLFYHSKWPS